MSFQSTKMPQSCLGWGVFLFSRIGLFVAIMAVGGNHFNNNPIVNDFVNHPMFL